MRILLFGEYSGLFNCLRDGFLELGHEVFLASNGDGYKNLPSDFRWDMHLPGRLGHGFGILNVFTHLKRFSGFDRVLLISCYPLYKRIFSDAIFDFLAKNNERVYLSGAGLQPHSFDYWNVRQSSKYYNYTQGELEAANRAKKRFKLAENPSLRESESRLFEIISGYIPIMYEYAEPYRSSGKCLKTIPIPVNLSKLDYRDNCPEKKVVFFHGLTRHCKGGEYIINAFEILKKKYPDVAEFVCEGGLPFDQYIQLIQRTNVVLDDVNAYSLGMNGLFSMAKGRIVMGGAEKSAARELGYAYCPAINLSRDIKQIVTAIEEVLDNKQEMREIGYISRRFVEEYHDHIKVAQLYIDLWA